MRRNLDESQSSDNEPEVVERNKSHRALTAFCTLCEHATLWGAVAGNENGLGHCREHWRINKARVLSVCVRVFTSLKDWLLLPFEKTTRSRLTAAVGKRCSGFLETFAVAPPDALCSQLRGKSGRKEGGDLHCACAASGFFFEVFVCLLSPKWKATSVGGGRSRFFKLNYYSVFLFFFFGYECKNWHRQRKTCGIYYVRFQWIVRVIIRHALIVI